MTLKVISNLKVLKQLFFQMPFISCSFCENTSKNSSKIILKLSKHLLDQLGAQKGSEFYSCTDHLLGGEDSVTQGARKRWRGDARLEIEVPDESRQSHCGTP